jgi:zinc protease
MRHLFLRPIGFTLLLVMLAACSSTPTTPTHQVESDIEGVHEFVLDNGMKVIVRENHRAPVVVSQIWYRVGSSYEHGGITGISHVLEHMMFKGTQRHGQGEFSRLIAELGGRQNAFTGRDFTAYFQTLERSHLETALRLEADRMRNLLLDEEAFAREIQVVMEERRLRTDDNPIAYAHEQFMAAAFVANPYQNPIIGWMDDLENLTVADLRTWYDRYYRPNNAILVVAGDVRADEVLQLAQRHFGPIPAHLVPADKPRREPPREGERRIEVKRPAQLPWLAMGYQVPVLRTSEAHWEPYALEVLAGILSGGDSARLNRELVRGRQLAASASAGYDLSARHDSLLTLRAVPAQGQDIASLETALREQIRRLQEAPVTAEELARVKAQVAASKVYELDSLFYQAMQIGILETVGLDWREGERYLERIQAVSAEQIMQVARTYLHDDALTVAILVPSAASR